MRLLFTKWGDQPHWQIPTQLLGEDDQGVWLGVPEGTVMWRPGVQVKTHYAAVVLVPKDSPFVAMFMDRAPRPEDPNPPVVYVDMTTVPIFGTETITAVDLDLDVIRRHDGTVFIDDEDEFVEHRELYGYPVDVADLAEQSCRDVVAGLTARRAPWDGQAQRWLAAIR
jgi:protein associated with RNAse G/E